MFSSNAKCTRRKSITPVFCYYEPWLAVASNGIVVTLLLFLLDKDDTNSTYSFFIIFYSE